ncbi:ABC transporter ATP-binding protein [Paraburkholderia xenovorans]|uniref:dipeptide ABC transporter ATP-binding protein n=1 Tax=Paraburkholderia xenovorans TaxID=36873 RepID=UPI0038B88239
MASTPLLQVSDLNLELADGTRLVHDVGFSVEAGEIVGIVGESGSGKTLAARSLFDLMPPSVRRTGGSIRFEGNELTQLTPARLRALRGARIGMVFQEPMTSLDPSMTIGRQLDEGLALHTSLTRVQRRDRILDMLTRVSIDSPASALGAYAHHFSGGMRQRIMLAAAMLLRPALLIADEPTTALDAIVQKDVLELMLHLTREYGTAVLLISHDLPMVARYTDRTVVMHRGRIVEQNATAALLRSPAEAYTRKLLASMPQRGPVRPKSSKPPLFEVRDLSIDYPGRRGLFTAATGKRALNHVNLTIGAGEVVAVVGASGSGKTTLGRTVVGLLEPTQGMLLFEGRPVVRGAPGWSRYRDECQMVFQDPASSLDPRMKVGALVEEALRGKPNLSPARKRELALATLEEVGLDVRLAGRYPHELSGGQRQRVAIARAVVRRPALIVADEPVSALDVTVRAQVLELFASLQSRYEFSCLFISHDLGVVEQIADRVVVMHGGEIVEAGERNQIFDAPTHGYTRKLLDAVPRLVNGLADLTRSESRPTAEPGDASQAPSRAWGAPASST